VQEPQDKGVRTVLPGQYWEFLQVFVEKRLHCYRYVWGGIKLNSFENVWFVAAIHGQGLIKSGKRAAKLIIQNVDDIIAVNFIGDFVLAMAKLIIVIISVLLAMLIFSIAPVSVKL